MDIFAVIAAAGVLGFLLGLMLNRLLSDKAYYDGWIDGYNSRDGEEDDD